MKNIFRQMPMKKPLFSALRAVYSPPKSIYQHLHFRGPFAVPVGDGKFYLNHYGTNIENTIFWEGLCSSWEGVSMSLWIELCKSSNFILDVGANTGVYALVAKAVNPTSQVHAFEPVKRVYERLLENCSLNKYDVVCVEKALSNYDGKAEIYDLPSDHIYSVTVNKNLQPPEVATVKVAIDAIRLDTYMKSLKNPPRIDLIKLDVETHEPEVLEGMGEYFRRFHPPMLIEILSDEVGQRVETLVKDCNYLYFNISEVGKPRWQQHVTKSAHFNYLFCDLAKAKELRLDL